RRGDGAHGALHRALGAFPPTLALARRVEFMLLRARPGFFLLLLFLGVLFGLAQRLVGLAFLSPYLLADETLLLALLGAGFALVVVDGRMGLGQALALLLRDAAAIVDHHLALLGVGAAVEALGFLARGAQLGLFLPRAGRAGRL